MASFATTEELVELTNHWRLIIQACPMGENRVKNVIEARFLGGKTFELRKDGDIIAEGSYHFRDWGGAWAITTSQETNYFFGSVMFCEGKLIFVGQPVDGCNHHFRKSF